MTEPGAIFAENADQVQSIPISPVAVQGEDERGSVGEAQSEQPLLTDPQIEFLVSRYKLEMARYEKTGNRVGECLRQELRQAGVKHMISSRPKHPTDLAEKLRKKAKEKPDIYNWQSLQDGVGAVVTDLAGCRVVVYSSEDERAIGEMVGRLFAQPERDDAAARRRRRFDEAYWATHALVHPYSPDSLSGNIDVTVVGAICELQIVTAAAHLFNEIEHDIAYKDRDAGLQANDIERQLIDELRGIARVADRIVLEILEVRARRRTEGAHLIETPEDLRFVLSHQAGRQVKGDELGRTLSLLNQCLDRVTPAAIRELGSVDELVEAGRSILGSDALTYTETVLYTVGLLRKFEPEIRATSRRWRGPRTPLRSAVEQALRNNSFQITEAT